MLTKGHAKIVPAGCFVPNAVDTLHSDLDWSHRDSFSKERGWIFSLNITFHTGLEADFSSFCEMVTFGLKMGPPSFLLFPQPCDSEKQMWRAIVAHALSSTGISVPLGRRFAFSDIWSLELDVGNVWSDSPFIRLPCYRIYLDPCNAWALQQYFFTSVPSPSVHGIKHYMLVWLNYFHHQ